MSSGNSDAGGQAQQKRSQVGGFQIVQKIGQGGMGTVFKAVQVSVKRTVALKILPPRLARNQEFVQRFLREAQSAAQLNHPNIVQAFDAGEADGYHYFAMEFVDGRPLSDFLQAGNPLPEKQALAIARDVALALHYAHESGIIHRDIKPANILLTSQGQPKLADLGLAREAASTTSDLTQAGYAIGTPDYISPEQVRGDAGIDGRTDLYSLGATLYHMLAGHPPYAGGTGNEVMAKHLADPIPDARKVNAAVSRDAARIVWRAMAKDPARRYQTGGEMAADIGRVLAAPAPGAGSGSARPRRQPAKGGRSGLIIGGIVAAILAAAVGIAFLADPGDPPNGHTGNGLPQPTQPANGHLPRETQADIDRKALTKLRSLPRATGEQLVETIRRYETAADLVKTPGVMIDLQDDLKTLRAKRAGLLDGLFEERRSKAARLAATGDYPAALKQFGGLPPWAAGPLKSRVESEQARLKAEAEATVRAALTAGEQAIRDAKPDAGLAALDVIERIQYPPLADEVSALRKRLESEKKRLAQSQVGAELQAARAALEALLVGIEKAAAAGDGATIQTMLTNAEADAKMKLVPDELPPVVGMGRSLVQCFRSRRLALVTGLRKSIGRKITLSTKDGNKTGTLREVTEDRVVLERVVRRFKDGQWVEDKQSVEIPLADLSAAVAAQYPGDWTPKTADDYIARALLALIDDDVRSLRGALDAAKGHGLHPRYAARLQAFDAATAEKAAAKAWEPLKPYLKKSWYRPDDRTKLKEGLDAFEKKHGATQFGKSVADSIRALRERLKNPKRVLVSKLPLVVHRFDVNDYKMLGIVGKTPTADGKPLELPSDAFCLAKPAPDKARQFTDDQVRLLARAVAEGGIRGVSLYPCPNVTDAGVAHFRMAPHLQMLAVAGTAMTDRSMRVVGGLTELRVLGLGQTKITDAGLAQLRGLTKLKILRLNGTRVTDGGLKYLSGLPSLRELDLNKTAVTAAGIRALKKALPGVSIDH
jgi:hypothetical protein